jgi:hypothetical protein
MMNLNSNTLLNQIEVLYNSFSNSWISGVLHFRGNNNYQAEGPNDALDNVDLNAISINYGSSENTQLTSWEYISRVVSSIIVWIILGFATGFLIGMI